MSAYRMPGRVHHAIDEDKEVEAFALALRNGTKPIPLWFVIVTGAISLALVVGTIVYSEPWISFYYPFPLFIVSLLQRRKITKLRKLEADAHAVAVFEPCVAGGRNVRFSFKEAPEESVDEPVVLEAGRTNAGGRS